MKKNLAEELLELGLEYKKSHVHGTFGEEFNGFMHWLYMYKTNKVETDRIEAEAKKRRKSTVGKEL